MMLTLMQCRNNHKIKMMIKTLRKRMEESLKIYWFTIDLMMAKEI